MVLKKQTLISISMYPIIWSSSVMTGCLPLVLLHPLPSVSFFFLRMYIYVYVVCTYGCVMGALSSRKCTGKCLRNDHVGMCVYVGSGVHVEQYL